ncbi:hypothetical protein [Halococcoides cellulosivorans]|uniref:hypothetical protein n=1 Tax=Halococcoides cellulosivorans TaxID=1679096 RepID=UPI001F2398E9|nr:hypothetical protein [Halococcoides cellulosivorans]
MSKSGEVEYHGTDDYPHHPEDRTQEEHALMGQVEAVAKFYAHNQFPEADILHPMWDPDHVDRGLDAILNYPMDEFLPAFREYYEALREPFSVIDVDRENIDESTILVHKTFTITDDNRVDEIEPLWISYREPDGTEKTIGDRPTDFEDRIHLFMPPLAFDEQFDYEAEFTDVIVTNLMAQIRDIYLNMGLKPPEAYDVVGNGKLKIHGDGIDTRPSASVDDVVDR